MRVEEKFNRKSAKLLEVLPVVRTGGGLALGLKVTFYGQETQGRTLSAHMTRDEALGLARDLVAAALRVEVA